MKAFKLTLFILGLIIGISFSITPIQKKPSGAEAQTSKPGFDRKFSEIEETVKIVIADLVKDSPCDGKCSADGLNCHGRICFVTDEKTQNTLAPFQLRKSEISQFNILEIISVFVIGNSWGDLRIDEKRF